MFESHVWTDADEWEYQEYDVMYRDVEAEQRAYEEYVEAEISRGEREYARSLLGDDFHAWDE